MWASNEETEPMLFAVTSTKEKAEAAIRKFVEVFEEGESNLDYDIDEVSLDTININDTEYEL